MNLRCRFIPVTVLLVLSFSLGCAQRTSLNYDPGNPPVEGVAILEVSEVSTWVKKILDEHEAVVDVLRARHFKLVPGRYMVVYATQHYKIDMVERQDFVDLKAGHTYRIRERACDSIPFSKGCRGRTRQATLWIEDETTGEVMAGVKWD